MKNEQQATHGGSRPGSGRKPNEDGQGRSVPRSIKISREFDDYLKAVGSGVIETTLRKSKAFKDWQRQQRG